MLTPQNGQTHLNNSSAFGDKLFECAWPFCGLALNELRADKHSCLGKVIFNTAGFEKKLRKQLCCSQ